MQNLDNDNNICICLGPTFIEHFSFPWKIEGPDSILTIQIRYKFIWPATAEYQYKKTIWKVTPTPSKLFLSQPKRKKSAKLCGLLHIWGQWTKGNFERVRKTIANSFLVKPLETSISFVAEKLLHHEKNHIETRSEGRRLFVWCGWEAMNRKGLNKSE